MRKGGFDVRFTTLPRTIALFPLAGVLLLPRVPIFEPRYLALTLDALGNRHWYGAAGKDEPVGSAQVYEHG